MNWYFKDDQTSGVITAKSHLHSKHKNYDVKPLTKNAMIFCLNKWDRILKDNYNANVYMENLKRFLATTPVYKIKDNDDWCFLHGGT